MSDLHEVGDRIDLKDVSILIVPPMRHLRGPILQLRGLHRTSALIHFNGLSQVHPTLIEEFQVMRYRPDIEGD